MLGFALWLTYSTETRLAALPVQPNPLVQDSDPRIVRRCYCLCAAPFCSSAARPSACPAGEKLYSLTAGRAQLSAAARLRARGLGRAAWPASVLPVTWHAVAMPRIVSLRVLIVFAALQQLRGRHSAPVHAATQRLGKVLVLPHCWLLLRALAVLSLRLSPARRCPGDPASCRWPLHRSFTFAGCEQKMLRTGSRRVAIDCRNSCEQAAARSFSARARGSSPFHRRSCGFALSARCLLPAGVSGLAGLRPARAGLPLAWASGRAKCGRPAAAGRRACPPGCRAPTRGGARKSLPTSPGSSPLCLRSGAANMLPLAALPIPPSSRARRCDHEASPSGFC